MIERSYAQLVADDAADDALQAWIEGGEEHAINAIERHINENARTIGEAWIIRDRATAQYRELQAAHH